MPHDVRMPDGTIIRDVPEGTTKADLQRRYQAHVNNAKPTSFWQGVAEEGLKAAHNVQDFADTINPLSYLARATGLDSPAKTQAIRAKEQKALNSTGYQGSTLGKVAGGIAATLPSMLVPGGPVVQGAVGGAMLTDKRGAGVLGDMAMGGIGGFAGQQIGKRVLAPVAERVGRTAPVRAIAQAAARKLGKQALPLPQISRGEKIVGKAVPQLEQIQQNLDDAARLNMPYSLADAAPELRTLGGSVARKSTNARALAENTFGPRSLGQADRAVNAIDQHLAPITNIEQRAGDIRQAASAAAQPHYDAAYARMAPVDEELSAMLESPAGKAALADAYQIAGNKGVDPTALGMDLNEQGQVVLKSAPSMQTLDLVKQALDSRLNSLRNPLSGKLDLEGDRIAGSVNDLLQRFKGKMDAFSPEYAQARQVYQQGIAPRTALQAGYNDLPRANVPQRQFDAALADIAPENMPEAQRGFATAMADQVDRARLSRNPYDTVYGSPLQQGKVSSMFPEGAPDFNRVYGLEQDMAKTATETIGGSPTAARLAADQQFDGLGPVADVAIAAATGNPLSMGRAVLQKVADARRVGMGAKRADELAPVLFDTNPQMAAEYVREMLRKQAEMQVRAQAYQRAGGLLGLPFAAGAIGATQP